MRTSYTYKAPPQKGFKTSTTQQPLPALKLVYRAHVFMRFKEQILIYLCYKAKNHTDNFLKQESPDCGPRGPSLQVSQPTTTSTALKKGEMQQLPGHGNLIIHQYSPDRNKTVKSVVVLPGHM